MACECIGCCATLAAFLIPTYFLIRWWAQGGQFKKNVRIDGKVVVITGANTGIGKETALDMASRGGRIYLACRDVQKAEMVRLEITQKTGNNNVYSRKLDLTSLQSVREFAEQFLKEETRLDILINNAGIMNIPRSVTKDGFETQFGTNHLGHFLLTNLLLDTIKASAPSRIVNVSSAIHTYGKINREDLQGEKSYSKFGAYAHSKLANVLFTRELAKRLKGTEVVTNSLHPGAVLTELQRYTSWPLLVVFFMTRLFVKTPKSGAQTTLAVALDPDLANVTGKYFADCNIKEESKAAQDDDTADWLWRTSEKLVGLSS